VEGYSELIKRVCFGKQLKPKALYAHEKGIELKSEVKDRLITGLAQYLSAQSAGSSKFAVADSYLAIDNYFTAVLLTKEIDPTKNHQEKLKLMWKHFENVFKKAKVDKTDLQKFYQCWQDVRYSSTIPTPHETLIYLRISNRIINGITSQIATTTAISADELEEQIYIEVLGGRWSSFEEECSHIHEAWQQEAEIQGEMGFGSKIGNKALNPSNFSEIRAMADDHVTKEILSNDPTIGSSIAKFYESFLNLVVLIQCARDEHGMTPNEIPNFMLSLKIAYHGRTCKEISGDWIKRTTKALKARVLSHKTHKGN